MALNMTHSPHNTTNMIETTWSLLVGETAVAVARTATGGLLDNETAASVAPFGPSRSPRAQVLRNRSARARLGLFALFWIRWGCGWG